MARDEELSVDLTSCDREPIHVPGRIQAFGCLVALTRDGIVTRVSANVADIFGMAPDQMLGLSFSEFVSAEAAHAIRGRLQLLVGADGVERLFGIELRKDEAPVDIAIHRSKDVIILEFELHRETSSEGSGTVRTMIGRLGAIDDLAGLAKMAARHMRALTGFHRVMVYRFAEDQSGEVIAEARDTEAESFLGLRYPASDIPRQARALYVRNPIRIISDVSAEPVPVVPEFDLARQPLDLSMSTLRAVSPIHVEYLKNMGVQASLSVSIIVEGELWGLFACHHQDARVLSYAERSAAELYGQLFSFALERQLHRRERADARTARAVHDKLMIQLADGRSMIESLAPAGDTLKTVVDFDGLALCVDREVELTGDTPPPEAFGPLLRLLNTTEASKVFVTDRLAELHPPAADYGNSAAGLMAIPVSRHPRDYMILFRREVAQHVNWAGNPEKPVELGPNGIRLTPRKSFEAWQETVRGRSQPWSETDIRVAEQLRVTLLEVVLKLTDAVSEHRREAENRQELLIAELNHRVRNILGLISGLIGQTRAESTDLAQFTEMIGGRIHALAKAHDQITKDQWSPASLRTLVANEAAAYLRKDIEAVRFEGPDIMIQPSAFSTIALVMHELVTNSAKYGALGKGAGHARFRTQATETGDVLIEWRDVGGPPVQAPTRRGFGSTIIERSVPHELKGDAEVFYEVTGLRAKFRLPARHVAAVSAAEDAAVVPEPPSDGEAPSLEGATVLVVEDNMIIALEAEDILQGLGAASVQVASTSAEAIALIGKSRPDAAVLDVNLGEETSEPAAEHLAALGIPFIFATGYGEATSIVERFSGVPVIQKPFGGDTMARALGKAVSRS